MMILDVDLEVVGEVVDARTQQGDLDFRRSRIGRVPPMGLQQFLSRFGR
jgi:hypothetical protein